MGYGLEVIGRPKAKSGDAVPARPETRDPETRDRSLTPMEPPMFTRQLTTIATAALLAAVLAFHGTETSAQGGGGGGQGAAEDKAAEAGEGAGSPCRRC